MHSASISCVLGSKYKNLATKASRTAHPSTGFKAHTYSSHPPHLTSQTPPWTYKIHDPNMSELFPELRTFSRQFTDSNMCTPIQGAKTYKDTVYQTKPSSRFPSVLLRVNRSCMSLSGTTVDNYNGATFVQLTKHTHSTHSCHTWYTSLNEQLFTRLKPQIYTLRTKDHQDPNTEYQRSPRSTNPKPTSHSLTDSLLSGYPPSL